MTTLLTPVGFAPDEVRLDEPTRAARLKWVIAVDSSLPPGRAVNAAVCAASSTGDAIANLLGPAVTDADGSPHYGLPWAGCTILAANPEQLVALRARGTASENVFVADMPIYAQTTRVYTEFQAEVAQRGSDELGYYAVSLVGPRNRIDKLTKGLALLA